MLSSAPLQLSPGTGLGAFTLGTPLGQIVNILRDRKTQFRCVEVKYAEQDLLSQDIIFNLPEHGIHLRFDPRSQRLRLIEAYDLSRAQVHYNAKIFGGAQHPATFVRVYEICGRTYPGEFDTQTNTYRLHYPGLLFIFPIPAHFVMFAVNELPLEFPDGTTPVASRFAIHAAPLGTSDAVLSASPPSRSLPADDLYYEVVEARLGNGLFYTRGGQRVRFGDTPQDVISELGCPSETVPKGADSMAIHAGAVRPGGKSPFPDYFYSYASRGVDILFCSQRNVVKKFVLRTNTPGHPDFSLYQKCNFRLLIPQESGESSRSGDSNSTQCASSKAQQGEEKGGTEQSYDAASVRTESNAKPKFGSGWVNPLESLIEGFTDWQFQPSSPQGGPAVVGAGAPVDGRRGDSGSGEPGLIPSDGSGAPDFDGHGLPDERDGWDDWDVQLLAGAEATNESTLESVRGRSDGLMTQYAKPGGTSSDLASTTAEADAITADSTWEYVKVIMGEAGRAAIHTQKRTHTFVYGYRGVSFEVLKSGYIASVTLFHP